MKNRYYRIIAITATASILTGRLLAEEPKPTSSPSPADLDINKLSSQMMAQIFDESIKPERAAQLAHFQKLYYDALVKEGFSKQEALEILKGSSTGLGAQR